jgi:ferredoxin-thioredoxin reductase catalytic subunit
VTGRDDEDSFGNALVRVTRSAERYSRKSGLPLNPDAAVRGYVLRGLARNLVAHGRPYCPCRDVTGEHVADRENICPCRTHRDEVARFGACECGLYVSARTAEELRN